MTTVAVRIPTPLRRFSDDRAVVDVELGPVGGSTVAAVLDTLARVYPGVVDRVLDEQGRIRRHVNVFVGEDDARSLGGLAAPVPDGAELTILPAVSGGASRVSGELTGACGQREGRAETAPAP